MVLLAQAQQNAACHALHSVRSRLCRWLLQSQDMIGSPTFSLTQEFLSHMLGVRLDEHVVALLHLIGTPQQILHRHALEHHARYARGTPLRARARE